MADSNTTQSASMGCTGLLAVLLTVLFVYLKLTGHIMWSWFWVISPALIYTGLGVGFLALVFGGIILVALGVGVADGIRQKQVTKKREEARRVSKAKPLGLFDSQGKKSDHVYKTHQWML